MGCHEGSLEGRELAELVIGARSGDVGAENELFRRSQPLILAVARRHQLDDDAELVQLTWLRVRRGLGSLQAEEKFVAWLRVVARNEAIELYRRRKRLWRRVETGLPAEVVDPHPFLEPGLELIRREEVAWVRQAVSSLSESDRHLLGLLFDGDLSYREIAEATNRPIGSIGPTRSRILARLRRQVDRQSGLTPAVSMAA